MRPIEEKKMRNAPSTTTKSRGILLLFLAFIMLIAFGAIFGIVTVLHLAIAVWYIVVGLIALILFLPLSIGGAVLYRQGSAVERATKTENKREQEVLQLLGTGSEIQVADLASRLEVEPAEVKPYVQYAAEHSGFSGYADWKGGIIYARPATTLTDKCPRCSGKRPIAGKTRVICPFCGTEAFIPNSATVEPT